MRNILFNSFRMDTEMRSGTYWLKSRNIICVPDDVYKKLHFCIQIFSKLVIPFTNNINAKPFKNM